MLIRITYFSFTFNDHMLSVSSLSYLYEAALEYCFSLLITNDDSTYLSSRSSFVNHFHTDK